MRAFFSILNDDMNLPGAINNIKHTNALHSIWICSVGWLGRGGLRPSNREQRLGEDSGMEKVDEPQTKVLTSPGQ